MNNRRIYLDFRMNINVIDVKFIILYNAKEKVDLEFSYNKPNLSILLDEGIYTDNWKLIIGYKDNNEIFKKEHLGDLNVAKVFTESIEDNLETIELKKNGDELFIDVKSKNRAKVTTDTELRNTRPVPKKIKVMNLIDNDNYYDIQLDKKSSYEEYRLESLVFKNRNKELKEEVLSEANYMGNNTYRFKKLPSKYLKINDVWNLFVRIHIEEISEYKDIRLFSEENIGISYSLNTAKNKEGVFFNSRLYVTNDNYISYVLHDYSPVVELKEVSINRNKQIECLLLPTYSGEHKFNVIIRHRKSGLEQILAYKIDKQGLINVNYSIDYQKTINIHGIWDFYITYNNQANKLIYKRIKANKEPKYNYLNTNIFINGLDTNSVRFYSTADQEASLYVDDPIMRLYSIKDSEEKIEIHGSFQSELLERGNKIKAIAYIDRLPCLTEISGNRGDFFEFQVEASKKDLVKDIIYPDSELKASLILKLDNKSYNLDLVNLVEDYKASRYMKYPAFSIDETIEVQPVFNQNSLYFKPVYNGKANVLNISRKGIIFSHSIQRNNGNKFLIGVFDNGNFIPFTNYFPINKERAKIKVKWNTNNKFIENLPVGGSLKQLYLISEKEEFYPINIDNKNLDFYLGYSIEDSYVQLSFKQRSKKLFIQINSVVTRINWKYKLKFYTAKLLVELSLNKKKTWIAGENLGLSMGDNGYLFYLSAKRENINEDVKYIYRPNIHSEVLSDKDLIKYDSFKHFLSYFRSQYLIVSHGIRDVLPSIYHHNKKNEKPVIYLQHGITAFKKLGFNSNSYNGMLKKMIVCSTREEKLFVNKMKFKRKQMANTGFVRYDYLVDESNNQEEKIIFIMPTWRDWLVNNESDFVKSKYYAYYSELLNSGKLNNLLKANKVKIKFLPHIEIRLRYMHLFKSNLSNIEIVDSKKESIQSLIKKSSLMVTDYSSVCFDFAYLNKPVIFFQFDLDEYLANRGSFVNMYTELFGPSVKSLEELIRQIRLSLNSAFTIEPIYAEIVNQYIQHHDKNNFQRIYKIIKEN